MSFNAQNRVEKYGPDGTLLWRADRPLDYGTEVKKKGKIEQHGGGISMSAPEMNSCSAGIAVDAKGRSLGRDLCPPAQGKTRRSRPR